jgi:hypothetical protein
MNARLLFTATCGLAVAGVVGYLIWSPTGRTGGASTGSSAALADAPIAASRGDLLDLAFSAASALPSIPHIKNRSRAQEAVVEACLKLNLPVRACGIAETMETWRQGSSFAAIAVWCARRGRATEADAFLVRAKTIAAGIANAEATQDWHQDRIRALCGEALLVLGRESDAAAAAGGLTISEAGPVEAERAACLRSEDFDARLVAIDAILEGGSFEPARNALEVCVALFDRFHDDLARRAKLETRIRDGCPNLPVDARADLLARLAETALAHGDAAAARGFAREAREMTAPLPETAERKLPRIARISTIRFRAGERDEARSDLAEALARYEVERAAIVDVFRARVLIPIAEAWHAAGDRHVALGVYRRALEEGVVNLNSRPRAEDLVAICCSMAVHGVEPDAPLLARLREVRGALGNPW